MKEFVPFETVRNNGLKLAHKIYKQDGFVPDVIYCSMRGGAYLANIISEYYKYFGENNILFAAIAARSYSGINQAQEKLTVDGWTVLPQNLPSDSKILLVDDIFDSGNTINQLMEILVEAGLKRENIKIAVHDYKDFKNKKAHKFVPDYFCRKHTITKDEENFWIHYMSHELIGLTETELEEHYFSKDPELRKVLEK